MEENKQRMPGDVRKEVYSYLEELGVKVTGEIHDKIRRFMMEHTALQTEVQKTILEGKLNNTANQLYLYQQKFGPLPQSKKQKRREKNLPHPQQKVKKISKINEEQAEPKSEFFAPKTFG